MRRCQEVKKSSGVYRAQHYTPVTVSTNHLKCLSLAKPHKSPKGKIWIAVTTLALGLSLAGAADDILIADFEGTDYGAWKTTGEAFGPGPARGTLPGQMQVDGFKGKGLVNSFYKGDGTTGTLTSPEFKIERKFISFLIGGGKDPEKTCMNLLVDGKVVRTPPARTTSPAAAKRSRRSPGT